MRKVIKLREQPSYLKKAISFFQEKWGSAESNSVYEDCLKHSLDSQNSIPQLYLIVDEGKIIAGCGLISNDFISRMDLYPWLCALYVEEEFRQQGLARLLIEVVKEECKTFSFKKLYLATDFIDFYEQFDFHYLADGYHPWGDKSRIYEGNIN
ncbi:MAG: GNAT family N-acetyltransferase [Lactococcus lactis]|nr:GNAT family N-acetyltransferase [Lactococcus lactis]